MDDDAFPKLTARQKDILDYIIDMTETIGLPPTRQEIAKHFGFKSVNAAEDHLRTLERKGFLTMTPRIARGMKISEEYLLRSKKAKPVVELPLVGQVAAGSPILSEEQIERHCRIDPSLFADKPDFLLRVAGNSMINCGISDGDLIAVKKTSTARNGQIVVARIDTDVTVKRYYKTGPIIELVPENQSFQTIRLTGDAIDFSIEGVVVGSVKSLR